MDIISFEHDGLEEIIPTYSAPPAPAVLSDVLSGGRVLREYRFGRGGRPAAPEAPATALFAVQAPAGPYTGGQFFALRGVTPRPIRAGGAVCGWLYEDAVARTCVLGGITAEDLRASREDQTRRVFARIEELLDAAGMTFAHVARTWFYLDRLLDWYGPFNTIRTDFFRERGVFDGVVPASTGIGAGNERGAPIIADVLAILPKDPRATVQTVYSPLQCPAGDYGSSFSRAVEIGGPGHRRLMVSGTASIDPDGASLHVGDIDGQISLTMSVVELLLESRDMVWEDAVRGIAYFKRLEDAPALGRYLARRGIPPFPCAICHSDVCRDELLFELEVDAIKIGS